MKMTVFQLRQDVHEILTANKQLSDLDKALARLDHMTIVDFTKRIKSIPKPAVPIEILAEELKSCAGNTSAFDAKLEEIAAPRHFKKALIVDLYDLVFDTETKLSSEETKKKMIKIFKAQHRRDVNYNAA